jgi:hypothetical protein
VIWWPSIVVGLVGTLAYGGALADQDAFAMRAHGATVVAAFVVSIVAWLQQRRWGALVGFSLLKTAAVVLWLPEPGFAVMTKEYEALSGFAFRDMLHWFWVVPPVLLTITLVESWWLSLVVLGRSPGDTWPWRRRYALGGWVTGLAVAAMAWWFAAPEYHLWKLRTEGHGPRSASLRGMGPRILPRLYEELDALGNEAVGEVRSTLVGIVADIRRDIVARRAGSTRITVVETTPADVDDQMVERLVLALAREPSADERRAMCRWLDGLDYRMGISTFCAAFDEVPPDTWPHLVGMLGSYVDHATRDAHAPDDSLYPWRGLSEAQIAERKADILHHLECAQPKLVEAITRYADDPASVGDFRPDDAARRLAAAGPLTDEQLARLQRAYVELTDARDASEVLHYLAPVMASDPDEGLSSLCGRLFRESETQAAREGILRWQRGNPRPEVVHPFVCDVFPDAPAETRRQLIHLLDSAGSRHGRPTCVSDVLMRAIDRAAEAGQQFPATGDWLDAAVFELRDQAPHEPRIRLWARSLLFEHGDAPLGTWYALLQQVADPE